MVAESRTFCDRCGNSCLDGRNQLRVEAGDLRAKVPEIDMCASCAESLLAWLRSGHLPADLDAPPGWPERVGSA